MNTVHQLLDGKGRDVWSIGPDASVYDAIHLMAEKQIGALLVIDDGKLVGIFSERDYARQVILKGRSSRESRVAEIMTADVITGQLDLRIGVCLALMTDKRIRHLPILEGGEVVGMVSMGDLVKVIIAEQQATIDQLQQYIVS